MTDWQNRIVSEGEEDADQLLANPFNARIHPKFQQDALSGVLDAVGWIQRVVVNRRTQHIIDGHLRVALAITKGAKVPVVYVDLTEDEEKLALTSFDFIGSLAAYDAEQTRVLLESVNSDNAAVQAMLSQLAVDVGIVPPDVIGAENGKTPEEMYDTFLNATIKQIVLYFENEEYDSVVKRLALIRESTGLTHNTAVFLKLLEHYENS